MAFITRLRRAIDDRHRQSNRSSSLSYQYFIWQAELICLLSDRQACKLVSNSWFLVTCPIKFNSIVYYNTLCGVDIQPARSLGRSSLKSHVSCQIPAPLPMSSSCLLRSTVLAFESLATSLSLDLFNDLVFTCAWHCVSINKPP